MFANAKYIAGLVLLSATIINSDPLICAAETNAIQDDPGLVAAVTAYNLAYAAQIGNCIDQNQTSCSVDLSAEQQTLDNACANADGRKYDPELVFSCDNDNTRTTTTFITGYQSCISTNCTTADLEARANEYLTNVTANINEKTSPNGVTCQASFSGAASMFSMAAATVSAVAAGAVMILSM